jgi:hypothetical protein
MAFSGVLHGVNPGLSPISVVVSQSGALVLDRENWVTTTGLSLELPQAPDGRRLKVVNSTTASITVSAASGARISGVTQSTGEAIATRTSVRILPGQRGVFVANGGNWIAQGCENSVLSFTYNGTPLASNTSNPLNASGLFHYLGILAGGGTWVNPAGTAQLTAATSSNLAGTVANLSDRVGSGQNIHTDYVAGSWRGWQFPKLFTCTGFWIQANGVGGADPRSFEFRVNTGSGLTNTTNVAAWTLVQSWTNQTQINTANSYYFFSVTTPVTGNQLALIQTSVNSGGSTIFVFQEFEPFGDLEP